MGRRIRNLILIVPLYLAFKGLCILIIKQYQTGTRRRQEKVNSNFYFRVCIEVPMQESRIFCLECLAVDGKYEKEYPDVPEIRNLHVQSVSHWAPANIGPYSQARKVRCKMC